MCENMVLKLRHCLAFCFERHLWVVTDMFCLWFLCDDWWSPALWRVLCFSLRRPYLVLTDESWTPPEAVTLTQVLCWWFKCITLWYVGHVYGQRTALSLARCLTWSHALVWLRWFCLPWWQCHLCSSGPEGEGRLQAQLSAPRSLGAWLKCFVSEQPSHPQSLVLRKGKIATITHTPWCLIQNTSHLCWNKIIKIYMYSASFLLFCLSAILNPAITFFWHLGAAKTIHEHNADIYHLSSWFIEPTHIPDWLAFSKSCIFGHLINLSPICTFFQLCFSLQQCPRKIFGSLAAKCATGC